LTLGALSTSADVSLSASSILDAGTAGATDSVNISADELRLVTTGTVDGNGAGTGTNHLEINVAKLAANIQGTGTGGLFLTETDSLQIGSLNAINVNQVGSDGTTLTATTDAAQSDLASAGNLVIVTTAGSIATLSTGGATSAAGHLLLQAGGANDITLGATLTNSVGHTSLNAGGSIVQNANLSATGAGMTMGLQAGSAITMAANTVISSSNGNILLNAAAGNVTLESVSAGSANVAISASADILDLDTSAAEDISATGLILKAGNGIGTGANPLEISVTTLSANAGVGGVFLTEANGVTADRLTVAVNRVGADATVPTTASGSVTITQEDLSATGAGHLVLVSTAGDILVNAGTSAGGISTQSGNILLQATAGALTLNAGMTAVGGAISLRAGSTLSQGVTGDISSTGAGSLDVQALSISMADGAASSMGSGNIRYAATGALTLGALSTSGDVSLSASSITDAGAGATDSVNISGDELRLNTTGTADGNGAGTGTNHLEVSVAKLAADIKGTGTGGLFVAETDSLLIGSLNAINVNQVGSDGTTLTATNDAAQSNLASAGHLVIVSSGNLEVLSTGGATSAVGNLLLQASSLTLGAALSNSAGHTSLNVSGNIVQNANISATATGTVDVRAGAAISMADGATTTAGGGNIRYVAATTLTLGTLSTTGDVSLSASSITDAGVGGTDTVNISADELRLVTTGTAAGDGAGTGANHLEVSVAQLAADSQGTGTGGLFLTETDGLQIGSLNAINVNQVGSDGTSLTVTTDAAQSKLASAANLVIVTNAGSIATLNAGGATSAVGNLLLQATAGDITLNATLSNSTGDTSLSAGGSIVQNANLSASGAGKTIDLVAGNAISMGLGAMTSTSDGHILLNAGTGSVTLETLNAGIGNVAITAGANILDGHATAAEDITAAGLILKAGGGIGTDGSTLNALETSVSTLSLSAGAVGAFVTETNGITVDALNVAVNRVSADATVPVTASGSASVTQEDLSSAGHLVLLSTAGDITVNAGTAATSGVVAAGNLLLQASAGSLTLNADVTNSVGHTSLNANGSILQNANISASAAGKTIELIAGNAISMGLGATTSTTNGNILLNAGTGSVTLETINAGSGNVAVTAGAHILDGYATAAADITAAGLILKAAGGIGHDGSTLNALETSVTTLSLSAGSFGAFISEADGLTVDTVTVSAQRVGVDATVPASASGTALVTQADLSSAGHLVLQSTAGNIVLNQGGGSTDDTAVRTSGTGNILIQTLGTGTVITANADILSASGNISVLAAGSVSFTNTADIRTSSTAAGSGSIDVVASSSSITQSATSLFTSTGASATARLLAATDVTVGDIELSQGKVSITAINGSISDGDALVAGANDADQDITASALRLNAGASIGTNANHLETTVVKLSAEAKNGSIYLSEADALTVDDVSLSVNRVTSDASISTASSSDAAQSDLRTTGGNGNIVLVAGGTVTLNNGTANTTGAGFDGSAVSAHGSGSILIDVNTGNLVVNSDITSGTGHITLKAASDVLLGSSTAAGVGITTGTAGTISIDAEAGALTMVSDAKVSATASSARMNAATSITLGNVTAANVSIVADTGAIINGLTAPAAPASNVNATNLRLQAGAAIGAADKLLSTAVDTLSASSSTATSPASTGIYLSELDGLSIGSVSATVSEFAPGSATPTPISDAAQADLTTGNNGSIVLNTGGTLSLNDGDTNSSAITANGSGTITVRVSPGNLDLNTNLVSTSGAVSLYADGIITLQGVVQTSAKDVQINTSAAGKVVFSQPTAPAGGTTAPNQDVKVAANTVEITTPVVSNGGQLLINTLPSTTPIPIVIGGVDTGTNLHLSQTELSLLQPGFTDITLGSGQAGQTITLQGQDSTTGTVATPVVFNDPLVVNATGTNSTVTVTGSLQGESLAIQGSVTNSTTTLTAADVSMQGSVTVDGTLQVGAGGVTITAGNSSTDALVGSLTVTGNIVGETTTDPTETLKLVSESSVTVQGTVSNIDRLEVQATQDVTFVKAVTVTGSVVINATGTVRFDDNLTLSNGGTLDIKGATSVVFASGKTVAVQGDMTIDAKSLALMGGANSVQTTGGVLTIKATDVGGNVVLGQAPDQAATAGALNLSSREIDAIGSGFSKVVIGQAGQGSIVLAANTNLTSVTATPVDVVGQTITIQASPSGVVQAPGAITLQASGDVVLGSSLSTVSNDKVTVISSGGNISMAQGTRLDSRGGDVVIQGANLSIGTVVAVSSTASGIVNIDAGNGIITDANQNSTADVIARVVNMVGYGPSAGSSGDVLEAAAEVVHFSVPSGLVVRDTGTDGRTYFRVMDGTKVYQQLVVDGHSVTRVTEDPNVLLKKTDAEIVAAGVPSNSTLLRNPTPTPSTAVLFAPTASLPIFTSTTAASRYLGTVSTAQALQGDVLLQGIDLNTSVDDLLSSNSYGLANRLEQSYVLGTPGEQPLVSGLDTFSQDTFEYWVDTLSL